MDCLLLSSTEGVALTEKLNIKIHWNELIVLWTWSQEKLKFTICSCDLQGKTFVCCWCCCLFSLIFHNICVVFYFCSVDYFLILIFQALPGKRPVLDISYFFCHAQMLSRRISLPTGMNCFRESYQIWRTQELFWQEVHLLPCFSSVFHKLVECLEKKAWFCHIVYPKAKRLVPPL